MELAPILNVDQDKCVNCHSCISVCPVKYANDGSKDYVEVNHNLCIGCGLCLVACTHGARTPIDDFSQWMEDLEKGEKIVAIVAPAASANFPGQYLQLNTWLKSIGVEACFDVSFGAELTVKSYLEHVKANGPKAVIAQPCPALVTFIQTYRPELLPHLAPADSPMMHTMKMVREYYPQYKDHKMMILSPCVAKKREFEEVGIGDYNVIIDHVQGYLEENKIDLGSMKETEYDNEPAERAVLFSSPGGLLETAERELPEIKNLTRKIEGQHVIYEYLRGLNKQIERGVNPLLIDCLNCDLGCNGGTGTRNKHESPDYLEHMVRERNNTMRKHYGLDKERDEKALAKLQKTIDKYWKPGLYDRSYKDLSENFAKAVKMPNEEEKKEIYKKMHKYSDADIKNCSACGNHTCEVMAIAIHNGLNKPENCHFSQTYLMGQANQELEKKGYEMERQKKEIINQSEHLLDFIGQIKEIVNK